MMGRDDLIIRYVALPLAGFLTGAIFFGLTYRAAYPSQLLDRLERHVREHPKQLFIYVVVSCTLYFLATVISRYYTHHIGFFDFGIYDWRIWQIHVISWQEWPEKFKSAVMGHFQPILVVYSILHNFSIEAVILNILQALAVLSGIIPLYLIAKTKFANQCYTLAMCFLYLLYPATQFNIVVDFHPDHLYIPLLFWSYYFIQKEKYAWTVPLVIAGYIIKEPLILGIAFFGLYMAWAKKKYILGLGVFFASLIIFYMVTFIVIPEVMHLKAGENATTSDAFGYLFDAGPIISKLSEVLRFEKWRFPFFLLFPLLFLPLLRFKEFLPAVPLFAIPILSTIAHHQNVGSHYTAGIIPPVFVAFVSSVAWIHRRFGDRMVLGILAWIGILMLAFNVAHSPSPLAIAFWNKDWSHGKWHYTNYLNNAHDAILKSAIGLIPADPSVKVVVHSQIYDKKLTHRDFYKPFPDKWTEADYVLLDNRRGEYVGDSLNEELYQKELTAIRTDPAFKLIYDVNGVLLFRKLER